MRVGSVFSLCAVVAATRAYAQTSPQGATTLLVSGNVESKLTLGISVLQRLAVQRVEDVRQFKMVGTSGKDGEPGTGGGESFLAYFGDTSTPTEPHVERDAACRNWSDAHYQRAYCDSE